MKREFDQGNSGDNLTSQRACWWGGRQTATTTNANHAHNDNSRPKTQTGVQSQTGPPQTADPHSLGCVSKPKHKSW